MSCTVAMMIDEIVNTSATEDLVLVIWANEPFDPSRPDTYFMEV